MKKSTKHIQFLRISLLIFALGFFFACSLGTQRYGKLSLSIEVPDYLKTETNEQPSNARFIHPNGDRLEFELYTESRVIHTQTITLNPQPNNPKPQTVPISVDKVPYNVPLFAKITVIGVTSVATGEEGPLGSNDIYIGYLKSGNNKLTLGVKPVSGANVAYEMMDEDGIYLYNSPDTSPDTFNIEMFPKKGLYTISCNNSAYIYLYDSDGKNYQNSFFINGEEGVTRIFYHPEDIESTYYAYLSGETSYLYGEKLDQDILITRYDDNMDSDVIVCSEGYVDFDQLSSDNLRTEITFTIYNPYPFTLNPNYNTEEDNTQSFTFNNFPNAILPGTSKEFTVIFESTKASVEIPITISANGLESFVMTFTGSYC